MRAQEAELRQPAEARQPRVVERDGGSVLRVRTEHVLGAPQSPLRTQVGTTVDQQLQAWLSSSDGH